MDLTPIAEVKRPFAWQALCSQAKMFAEQAAWASYRLQTIRDYLAPPRNAKAETAPAWLGHLLSASGALPTLSQTSDRHLSANQFRFIDQLAKAASSQTSNEAIVLGMLNCHRTLFRNRRVVSYRADRSIDLTYLPATLITSECMSLCRSYKRFPELPPILLAIGVFAHFIAIHPFMDGNGRGARLLITALLRHTGLWVEGALPLAYLMYRDRKRHLAALRPVLMEGNWSLFVPYALHWLMAAAELALITGQGEKACTSVQSFESQE